MPPNQNIKDLEHNTVENKLSIRLSLTKFFRTSISISGNVVSQVFRKVFNP